MRLSTPIHRLKREARRLARDGGIPLHAALDRVARAQGFSNWSHLASRSTTAAGPPKASLLPCLCEGDMLVLGARPRQGKTLEALHLLLEAVRERRRAVFFTLEETEASTRRLLARLGRNGAAGAPEIVAEDGIDAAAIAARLTGAPAGTLAVVDYLQVLDRSRTHPPLGEQMEALGAFARRTGTVLCFLSQIGRSFDPARDEVPSFEDVLLPNPIPPNTFSKACFLHEGRMRFGAMERGNVVSAPS